jgi:hypothetical protein
MRADGYQMVADSTLGKNEGDDLVSSPEDQPAAHRKQRGFEDSELANRDHPTVLDNPISKNCIHFVRYRYALNRKRGISAANINREQQKRDKKK